MEKNGFSSSSHFSSEASEPQMPLSSQPSFFMTQFLPCSSSSSVIQMKLAPDIVLQFLCEKRTENIAVPACACSLQCPQQKFLRCQDWVWALTRGVLEVKPSSLCKMRCFPRASSEGSNLARCLSFQKPSLRSGNGRSCTGQGCTRDVWNAVPLLSAEEQGRLAGNTDSSDRLRSTSIPFGLRCQGLCSLLIFWYSWDPCSSRVKLAHAHPSSACKRISSFFVSCHN